MFFVKLLLILVIITTLGNLVGQVALWAPPIADNTPTTGGDVKEEPKEEEKEIIINVSVSATVVPTEDNKVP